MNLDQIRRVWKMFGRRAWEPVNPQSNAIKHYVENHVLERVDGRCGFEAFKDSHVKFTEIAPLFMENLDVQALGTRQEG